MSELLTTTEIDLKHVNHLRVLANQMITEAGSGHPGIVLGAAPILYELYANQMRINPQDPGMLNRDRVTALFCLLVMARLYYTLRYMLLVLILSHLIYHNFVPCIRKHPVIQKKG